MAKKRMFRLDVLETDSFMEMPLSTQALYFHLCLRADDDGFIGNPKQIVRMIGANQNDLDLLIAKKFVLIFDDGIIVIKHWRLHNTLSANRYSETKYIEDKALLRIKKNKSYTLSDDGDFLDDNRLIETSKRQTIDKQKTNNRQAKDKQKTSSDKNSIDKNSIDIDKINNKHMAIELFEKLWKLYPKKKGKGQVSNTQKQKLLKIGYDKMVIAIDKYKDYVKDKDEQYIMYGSTFFNSGYVDYISDDEEDDLEIDVTKYGVTKEWFDSLSEKDREDFLNERR